MSSRTFDPDLTTGALDDEPTDDDAPPLPRWSLTAGGDFAPDGILGEGGMSVVERATQQVPRRSVALKRPRRPGQRSEVRALLREGEVTAQVEHPNVVPVHAIGEDERGDPVVVLRAIRGRQLADEPRPTEAAGWRHLAHCVIAVCRALEAAHHKGWIHCDVKSANILLGEFGETWLVDWGIAQRAGVAAGVPRGTPGYFSPEQARGGVVDARTDVFLLGSTLTHLLTGRARHRGSDLGEYALAAEQAVTTEWPPDAPRELGDLADRCCRPDPADRPPDVATVRKAIEVFVEGSHLDGLVRAALRELESTEPDPVARRVRLVKAQFALAEASALGNARARDGLVRALDALIDADLTVGNVVSARSWAAGHPAWSAARATRMQDRVAALDRADAERARVSRDWGLSRGRLVAQLVAMGVAVLVVAVVALSVQGAGLFTDIAVVRVVVALVLLGVFVTGRAVFLARGDPGHLTRSLLNGGVAFLLFLAFSRMVLGVWMRAPPELAAAADLAATGAWTIGWWSVFRTSPLVLAASAALLVGHVAWPGHSALFLNLQVCAIVGALSLELLNDRGRGAGGAGPR